MRDGGNGDTKKATVINIHKYENLAMIYIPGMVFTFVGLKAGRELRKPFIFISGEKAIPPGAPPPPPGVTPFALAPMPFCDDCFFLEGGYFWHKVTDESIQKTFHQMISPIIMP
jgi:hypothetical protein